MITEQERTRILGPWRIKVESYEKKIAELESDLRWYRSDGGAKGVSKRIADLKERVAELESEEGLIRSKSVGDSHSIKTRPTRGIKVMKVNY